MKKIWDYILDFITIPFLEIVGIILFIIIPVFLLGGISWIITNWRITLPIFISIIIVLCCVSKTKEIFERKKYKNEQEIQRQKAQDFCKNHPEVDKPINYEIVPFEDYIKKEYRWYKYGKGLVNHNANGQLCVFIFNILKKSLSINGFQSIDSYVIPIFDVCPIFKTDSLVNLKESEIIWVITEDGKRRVYINPKLFSNEESCALLKYEQIYPTDAKKDFPFKVEILNAKELLDQSDETKLERINGKWGLKCIKHEGDVTKFIPLLNNLQIESLPTTKWELEDKQAKLYLYHFAAYEKNEKYIPNNIFADRTQPTFIWKETTKIYIDSEIIFDIKLDLAFTVIELVSLCDNRRTVINIVDERYSLKGVVVKTVEFPSFEGDFAPLYSDYLSWALDLAKKCEEAIKTGRFFGQQDEQTQQIGEQNATIHDGLSLVKKKLTRMI